MTSDQPIPAVPARDMPLDERFRFGKNWADFLRLLDDTRIERARQSLRDMLGVHDLQGKSFLDIGCGSGLFSLAARQLGARVVSFDFDPDSVGCAEELRRRYFQGDLQWDIRRGSALDADFVRGLGKFDVVYSWGVLHHTGHMWDGLGNAGDAVAPGGQLFIAIYNDQGKESLHWLRVKKLYNSSPKLVQKTILGYYFLRRWGGLMFRNALTHRDPFHTWNKYKQAGRGMNPWHDLVDWVGGYPFEVAKPEEIFDFFRAQGFELRTLKTCSGGLGCNEFVFRRSR